jgi:hypothetical protein
MCTESALLPNNIGDYFLQAENYVAQKKSYALVYIKNGQAVLADLLIDKMPIREYLQNEIAR